jgi:hypothetical protein
MVPGYEVPRRRHRNGSSVRVELYPRAAVLSFSPTNARLVRGRDRPPKRGMRGSSSRLHWSGRRPWKPACAMAAQEWSVGAYAGECLATFALAPQRSEADRREPRGFTEAGRSRVGARSPEIRPSQEHCAAWSRRKNTRRSSGRGRMEASARGLPGSGTCRLPEPSRPDPLSLAVLGPRSQGGRSRRVCPRPS